MPVLVVKKDGSRQPFNIEKIRSGMTKACEKRPVSMTQIDQMAEDIQKQVQNSLLSNPHMDCPDLYRNHNCGC